MQSYLTPKAGDTAALKVTINATSVNVNLAKDGTITAADGSALYLDSTGNLTQNSAGNPPVATLDRLAKNHSDATTPVATTITNADGTSIALAGSTNNGTSAGTIAITGAVMTDTALQSASAGKALTVGSNSISAAGAVTVTSGGAAVYTAADSTLTTTNTKDYFLQTDGSVTNGSGKAVYTDAKGQLTTNAATTSAATADPLKALDDAISQIDNFRSSLGAVQNRFDSAITNLSNTKTNLQSAQSRIQDADYATEVSAMSKAHILQQAGTTLLSKANQVTQSELTLLQG